jgi:hypothetical protein
MNADKLVSRVRDRLNSRVSHRHIVRFDVINVGEDAVNAGRPAPTIYSKGIGQKQ